MSSQQASVVWVHDVLLATFPDNPTDQTIEQLQETILDSMTTHRPAGVILDLSGVMTVDSFFARVIAETADMIDLMGAKTVLVGIQPPVAITAAELGYDLGTVRKARNTEHALELLGVARADPEQKPHTDVGDSSASDFKA